MSSSSLIKSEAFNSSSIRIAVSESGEPMFCFPDVCAVLEIDSRSANRSMSSNAKTPEITGGQFAPQSSNMIGTESLEIEVADARGQVRPTKFINERSLYKLAFRSRSQAAEQFTDWVAGVVVQLRKTGVVDLRPQPTKAEQILSVINMLQEEVAEERAKRLEAERTKAQISNTKTATALGRLGGTTRALNAAKKEAEELKIKLDESTQWMSIIAFAKLQGLALSTQEAKSLGSKARKLSIENGVAIKQIPDPRWGTVNSYHISILNRLMGAVL